MARKSNYPAPDSSKPTEPEAAELESPDTYETQGPHDPRDMLDAPAVEAEEPVAAVAAPEPAAVPVVAEPEAKEPAPAFAPPVPEPEKPWTKVRVITATTVSWNGCMLKLQADDVLDAGGYGPGFIQALRDAGVPLENLS